MDNCRTPVYLVNNHVTTIRPISGLHPVRFAHTPFPLYSKSTALFQPTSFPLSNSFLQPTPSLRRFLLSTSHPHFISTSSTVYPQLSPLRPAAQPTVPALPHFSCPSPRPTPNCTSPDHTGQQNRTFPSQTAPPLTSVVRKTTLSALKPHLCCPARSGKLHFPVPNCISADQPGQQNRTFPSQTAPPLTRPVSKTALPTPTKQPPRHSL